MQKLKQLRTLLLALAIFTPLVDASEISNPSALGNVPLFMQDIMKEVGCAPITDYYVEYYMEKAPFAQFGKGNFAFLCEQKTKSNTLEYLLILRVKPDHHYAECEKKILLKDKPGGVTIYNQEIDASDFISYKTRKSRQFKTEQPTLSIGSGGGFIEFICINKEWMFDTGS